MSGDREFLLSVIIGNKPMDTAQHTLVYIKLIDLNISRVSIQKVIVSGIFL